jgi:glycosyltransferase involved in cell wall biosynthesis
MKIVIDMQGAQTESRFRGIGRYTISFVKAVIRNAHEHHVVLVFNGMITDSIAPLKEIFADYLPEESLRVWSAPAPVSLVNIDNSRRLKVAEILREAFILSLQPDVIHITSLFEGYTDNAVTTIGVFDKTTPVTVTLYDLIPLIYAEAYLGGDARFKAHYMSKVAYLRQSAVNLAISDFTKQEALTLLDVDPARFINKSSAVEHDFASIRPESSRIQSILAAHGIIQPFLLYTGGADERKNLPRLVDAYCKLTVEMRGRLQLVFAGKMTLEFMRHLREQKLPSGQVICLGYVSDEDLVSLYSSCQCFVFPSWHEGFGLPALEAMTCGAAVIGADAASLPEVIGREEALFDPFDVDAITACLSRIMEDYDFLNRLKEHAEQRATAFSWDATAQCALATWQAKPWAAQQSAAPPLSVGAVVEEREGEATQHTGPAVASAEDMVNQVVERLTLHRCLPDADTQLRDLARALDSNHPSGEAAAGSGKKMGTQQSSAAASID